MLTKEDFETQIIDGIKTERLDPCNDALCGEIDTNRPQYYWTVEDNQVVEESPFYVGGEHWDLRFGISINSIELYTEKDFEKLSEEEIRQAMLDIVNDYGVDDWYDQYQQSLETEV